MEREPLYVETCCSWGHCFLGDQHAGCPTLAGLTPVFSSPLESFPRQPARPQMVFFVFKANVPNGLTLKTAPSWTHTAISVLYSLEIPKLLVQTGISYFMCHLKIQMMQLQGHIGTQVQTSLV